MHKKFKRATALLLALVMLATFVPAIPLIPQAAAAVSGDYEYEVYNGNATITGYNGEGGNITIPDTLDGYPVTSIGWDAFYNCTALTDVTIPDSVTSIGWDAFANCTGLTDVTIGNSVTKIGEYAFADCTALTAVTIGTGVTEIGEGAFHYYDYQREVYYPLPNLTIYCNTGSYAYTYAQSRDIPTSPIVVVPVTYTIQFMVDGKVFSTQTIEAGKPATAPTNPTKTGYTFSGWDKAINNITGDLVVNAKWKISQYMVAFKNGTVTHATQMVEHGKAATAPANPTKTGYTFDGWDKAINNITGNLTVNAKWKINQYTVTFKNGTAAHATQTVEHGKPAAAPANPKKTGHTFDGWDKTFNKITGNLTVNAKWKINQYTVTFKNGNKTLKTQKVNYNKAATAPKKPTKKGYTFNKWDKKFNKITKNITVKAKWKKVTAPTKAPSGLKLSSPKTKRLKVTYRKVTGAAGYRIQYTTDKSFKKSIKTVHTTKLNATITKLAAKTRYYVRVTAYKVDSTKAKVYSKKSAAQNFRTK